MKLICWHLLFALLVITASAQNREVAITIDDLPLNGGPFEVARIRKMTANFLAAIKKHQIPTVGFVNERLLYHNNETDARIAILKQWLDGGVELGNHTFSHLGFANASLADFEDDFVRGDAVTRLLMRPNKPRFFRHPFLQQGKTAEDEKAFEDFAAARGYKMAPVTVDVMDWMIVAALSKARSQKDEALVKRVGEEYIKFAVQRFDYCDQIAQELFGRSIKHIVLMHANELTAENLDALATILKSKGYKFISVEQALQDPIYQMPDKYFGSSDRLGHWAFSKGKRLTPPQPPEFLRQPNAAPARQVSQGAKIMIDRVFAERFAAEWIAAWNSHDLASILSHYTEDFEMASPRIVEVMNEPSGKLQGKTNVAAYWGKALERSPDLHFDLQTVLTGTESVTLYYRNHRQQVAAEVFYFAPDGRVRRAAAHYAPVIASDKVN